MYKSNISHLHALFCLSDFTDSSLRLLNNFNVTLRNVNIVNCSHQITDNFPENSAVSLVYRNSGQNTSYVQIFNSQFHYNSIKLVKGYESTSEGVIGERYPGRGGALGLFINDLIINKKVNMIIDGCNFTNNTADAYGGAIYLTSNGLSSGHNYTLINSVFDHNYAAIDGGGISEGSTKTGVTFDTVFDPSHYYLNNCNFTENSAEFGGAVGFVTAFNRKRTTDTVSISNCIFEGNIGRILGAAIMMSTLTYPNLPEQDSPYIISNW